RLSGSQARVRAVAGRDRGGRESVPATEARPQLPPFERPPAAGSVGAMLSVSRLLNGTVGTQDALRYGRATSRSPAHLLHFSRDKKPVVVWNATRRCNLHCAHCYSDS